MKFSAKQLLLYAVTDRGYLGGQPLEEAVEQVLQGGATCIQLREKEASDEEMITLAKKLKSVCAHYGVPLLINDRVKVALEVDADGVHVGQDDFPVVEARRLLGPEKIIGTSAHNVKEAEQALRDGADYIGSGAVFGTGTKIDAGKLELSELKEICAVGLPVVAIGGIQESNLLQLKGLGISGVAVVSALFCAKDKIAAARRLTSLSRIAVGHGNSRKTALTVAGSDPSGGAGIQADLKTMTANGVYGMSVITALTAQNTTGVSGIFEVPPEFVAQQMDCVFSDIPPDAVKTGMLGSSELIRTVAAKLREYHAGPIVVDPVMVSTSGSRLLPEDAVDALKAELLPIAMVLTPNIPEAEVLAGMDIQSGDDMQEAARRIQKAYGCAVLCKGGHRLNDAGDLLYADGKSTWFYGKRVDTQNTHGTGCTLSSAIASNLAKGKNLEEAVRYAKEYLSGALAAGLELGAGSGPMDHAFAVGKC